MLLKVEDLREHNFESGLHKVIVEHNSNLDRIKNNLEIKLRGCANERFVIYDEHFNEVINYVKRLENRNLIK